MAKAYIGIGSNVGDRGAMIEAARLGLSRLPGTTLLAFSPIYETDPVGPIAQGRFLNAAAVIQTDLKPRPLLEALRAIEAAAGRPPESQRLKWGPRSLDLDILLYDELVISDEDLIVPHPFMHERWFVLRPLADIAPGAVHPLLEMTVADLLRHVEQKSKPDR